MNTSEFVAGVYPTLLTLTNLGLGAALYRTGADIVALVLWLAGAAVLACLVSVMGLQLGQLRTDGRTDGR